jgi:hypothetical protein
MLFVIHLDIVLWKAATPMLSKEATVSTLQNIDFWEGKLRIVLSIGSTILLTDVTSHKWRSMRRVFAMKDQESLAWSTGLEESASEQILIIIIDGTEDMATLELILEPTINNHTLIILTVIDAIQDLQHGILRDSWDAVRVTLLEEMGEYRLMQLVHIHHGVEVASRNFVLLGLHHVPRMLEHT